MMKWKKSMFWLLFAAGIWAMFATLTACSPTTPDGETAKEQTSTGENSKEGTATDAVAEKTPEPKPEPRPEPRPEPKPEPTPEPSPEPSPEPTPDDGGVADGPGPDLPLPDEGPADPNTPSKPKAYSGGTCPTFTTGLNKFKSGGLNREFLLFLPNAAPKNAGLLFLWHGLGDNPQNFSNAFQAAAFAKANNVIVVVPKGATGPKRPPTVSESLFNLLKGQAPQLFETWAFFDDPKNDLYMFDDVLSCVDKQYDIDNKKVYTTGFSAGALWSSKLTMLRSGYLAATVLFSGGSLVKKFDLSTLGLGLTGIVTVTNIPYVSPKRKIPVLIAWGGPQDQVSMGAIASINFEQSSKNLSTGLQKDKHFIVECNHGGKHTVPAAGLAFGSDFLMKHTYGTSSKPYANGLPSAFPSYCKIVKPAAP